MKFAFIGFRYCVNSYRVLAWSNHSTAPDLLGIEFYEAIRFDNRLIILTDRKIMLKVQLFFQRFQFVRTHRYFIDKGTIVSHLKLCFSESTTKHKYK
jgi:hypothetical protein